MNFKLNNGEKINVFLGDDLLVKGGVATRNSITKLVLNEFSNSQLRYVTDSTSLSIVTQAYLDSGVGSRDTLLRKIRQTYSTSGINGINWNELISKKYIKNIISFDYDNYLELSNSEKVCKVNRKLPVNCTDNQISLYKIFGDIADHEGMILTSQDIRKYKILPFYKEYFKKLINELKIRKTVILGDSFKNSDILEFLTYIFSLVNKEELQPIVYVTENPDFNESVLKFLEEFNIIVKKGIVDNEDVNVKEEVVEESEHHEDITVITTPRLEIVEEDILEFHEEERLIHKEEAKLIVNTYEKIEIIDLEEKEEEERLEEEKKEEKAGEIVIEDITHIITDEQEEIVEIKEEKVEKIVELIEDDFEETKIEEIKTIETKIDEETLPEEIIEDFSSLIIEEEKKEKVEEIVEEELVIDIPVDTTNFQEEKNKELDKLIVNKEIIDKTLLNHLQDSSNNNEKSEEVIDVEEKEITPLSTEELKEKLGYTNKETLILKDPKDILLLETAAEIKFNKLELKRNPIKFSNIYNMPEINSTKLAVSTFYVGMEQLLGVKVRIIDSQFTKFLELRTREFRLKFSVLVTKGNLILPSLDMLEYEIFETINAVRLTYLLELFREIFSGEAIYFNDRLYKCEVQLTNPIQELKFNIIKESEKTYYKIMELMNLQREKNFYETNLSYYELYLLNNLGMSEGWESWVNVSISPDVDLSRCGHLILEREIPLVINGPKITIKEKIIFSEPLTSEDKVVENNRYLFTMRRARIILESSVEERGNYEKSKDKNIRES